MWLTLAGIIPRCFEWSKFFHDVVRGSIALALLLILIGCVAWGVDTDLTAVRYAFRSVIALMLTALLLIILVGWLSRYVC